MKGTTSMIDQYFDIYTEQIKEYGEKTAILMLVGSFLEMYQIDNNTEKIGNAKLLSNILNLKYANKNGNIDNSSRSYPNFVGFTQNCLNKYLPVLLENDFTAVIVNQLESSSQKSGKLVKRGITAIYSKCLQPLNLDEMDMLNVGDHNLVHVILKISKDYKTSNKRNAKTFKKLTSSISSVNNFTNEIIITENSFDFAPGNIESCLNDFDRILYKFFASELHVYILNENDDDSEYEQQSKLKKYFINNYENVKMYNLSKNDSGSSDTGSKDYFNVSYQNEYLKNVYKHVKFGLLSPIEYLNLERFPLSIVNLIYTINFMSKHDLKYISNLNVPKIINENDHLVMELDTLSQLNIDKGVFNIINHTKTAIGKRHLHSLLCKPFKDPEIIKTRYALTEALEEINKDGKLKYIIESLSNIPDFEKLHRKMALEVLHPYEFEKLHRCYKSILDIIGVMYDNLILNKIIPNKSVMNDLYEYINDYTRLFNIDIMKNFSLNTTRDEISNYFNKNVISELDTIQNNINELEKERELLRMYYDNKINNSNNTQCIKLVYSEGEGYSFSCTKIRYQTLLSKLKGTDIKEQPSEFKLKITNSITKFVTPQLQKLSSQLLNNRELLSTKINLHYINLLKNYYQKYNSIFNDIKTFVQIIDVTISNFICKNKYNYVKPELIYNDSSFIEAKQLRHAIIERINTDTEYITNDIILNEENPGMLLYGLNSSGKSSMLRAIGICIVLSQCGLYVPCSSFKFSPFSTMISQVDLTDNMYAGKSSFITELTGLKKIIACSGKNTICLGDETLKGTETNSAMGLICSMILKLYSNGSKFFFTSHLHDIPNIKEIKELDKLQIKHLSVNCNNNNIIFERKLKEGPGSDLYGIEVAQSIIEDSDFIDIAFSIRNVLTKNKKGVLSNKKSVYNKKKIITSCQICESTNKLETHHINEQKNADNITGIIKDKHFHKNEKYNLAVLCHDCHLQVTLGNIIVRGYNVSLNGTFLDYQSLVDQK